MIMKKSIFSCISVLALLLMATACTSEDELIATGDELNVSFTASLDQFIDSRAISDGSMVDRLTFIAYDENGNEIAGLRQTDVPVSGGKATVETRVVKGHRYTFAFWAQNSTCTAYSFTDNMKSLKVDYDSENGMHANDESRDAFYAVNTDFAQVPVTEPFEKTVILHRPFAQLNFGTTDDDMVAAAKMAQPTGSRITIEGGVCSTLNLLSGVASGAQPIELDAGPFLEERLVADGQDYFYLSMNYLLVNTGKSNITDINMTTVMNRNNKEFTHELEIDELPVQRNYRTNVVGRLITREVDFNIIIDNSFTADESYYPNDVHWTTGTAVEPMMFNGQYRIYKPEHLAWFQDHEPEDGSTIYLGESLDLDSLALRPLMVGGHNITIEGNNKAIRNFTITTESGSAALFGNATDLTVKNLTVQKAIITAQPDADGNAVAGAIVAQGSGTITLDNVTVNRSAINGACMVGAMVGTVTAGGHIVANGCMVSNSTVENTESGTQHGLAGGMVGYIASGAADQHLFSSCEIYNTVVKARMIDPLFTSGKVIGAIQGNADTDVVSINNGIFMVNFQGLDDTAAGQVSPYGSDQLIGGNQNGHGHIYINNVELILGN